MTERSEVEMAVLGRPDYDGPPVVAIGKTPEDAQRIIQVIKDARNQDAAYDFAHVAPLQGGGFIMARKNGEVVWCANRKALSQATD